MNTRGYGSAPGDALRPNLPSRPPPSTPGPAVPASDLQSAGRILSDDELDRLEYALLADVSPELYSRPEGLLACPFCGSTAELYSEFREPRVPACRTAYVTCTRPECGARGHVADSDEGETEQDALTAWNRRES